MFAAAEKTIHTQSTVIAMSASSYVSYENKINAELQFERGLRAAKRHVSKQQSDVESITEAVKAQVNN